MPGAVEVAQSLQLQLRLRGNQRGVHRAAQQLELEVRVEELGENDWLKLVGQTSANNSKKNVVEIIF